MEPVLSVVWTFWISVALVVATVLLILGILAMYVVKVIVPKYPKR
jgi:hypothetical protein